MYEDCVGPSAYWKAQGKPVSVWGLLVNGSLRIAILPDGIAMNRFVCEKLVQQQFANWLRDAFGEDHAVFLVQDHERCLWSEEP